MKTLDWSVETLGRECNSTALCIRFFKTGVVSDTLLKPFSLKNVSMFTGLPHVILIFYAKFHATQNPHLTLIAINIIKKYKRTSTLRAKAF